ncbi:hypothetical protein QWY20_00710 [Alkalimonas sp. MEB108]|uniref:Uncharacterized protein n=1 Tax=Alkalimonas cellulosilytica TaxID=3058395 RepID=A0ABU7J1T0_9GAMM|nr:hypothetical protein [Alkalimonas sp. MEB108]MEE1999960.1 hypothetical protein [Alkalimonas sp. MEB108]
MKQSVNKQVFLQTIGYAPWLLVIYSAIFLGICFFESPSYLVLMLGVPFGFYAALILPFLWRRSNDWLGAFLVVIPAIFFSIWSSNHWEAVQTVLVAAVVTCVLWWLFKNKFISYVSRHT